MPQFHPFLRGSAGSRGRRERREDRPAVHRPGTVDGRAHPGPALPRGARPLRHRRGALRLPVGARLPSRVPAAFRPARALPRGAKDRAHRDRGRTHPPRDRAAPGPRGRADVRQRLRPAEHPVRRDPQEPGEAAASALHRGASQERRRHRVLSVAAPGRRHRGVVARHRGGRAAVPRGPRCVHPPAQPGPLPARRGCGDRGHHRFRHGDRQAGRALRRPPRFAEEHRSLLPGDGARRARRVAGRCLDGLRTAGGRGAAPDGGGLGRGRDAEAAGGAQARRHARLLRVDRVPASDAACLFRRDLARALRQLRQLPDAGGGLGRHGSVAEGSLVRLPHGPDVRGRVPDRRAQGPGERAHPAFRPRPHPDPRCRRRSGRVQLALGLPATGGPWPAERRHRGVRIAAAHRGQLARAARRDRGAHAARPAAAARQSEEKAEGSGAASRSRHLGRSPMGGSAHSPHRVGQSPGRAALRGLPRFHTARDGGAASPHPRRIRAPQWRGRSEAGPLR